MAATLPEPLVQIGTADSIVMASTPVSTTTEPLATPSQERWLGVRVGEDRFLVALAIALALHLLPLVAVVGGGMLAGGGGEADEVGVGDPHGMKGAVNVEMIDGAELKQRYISFNSGKDASDSEAASKQSPAEQQRQAEKQQQQQPQASEDLPPAPEQPQEPGLKPKPTQKFSEQEIAQILQGARNDMQDAVQVTSAASMARLGQASEYVRGVLRKLKETMPRTVGLKGTVLIGFVVGDAGEVALIRVLKSSGRPELDRQVVDRIRSTQFIAPAKNAPAHERIYRISYTYD